MGNSHKNLSVWNQLLNIRTKVWRNSHWMVPFQKCVRQSRSPTKMAATVQLRCYWKQLWSMRAITGSWEPLVISSPCQRQWELLPSLGVRRLSFVNFSHFNLLLSKNCSFCPDPLTNMAAIGNSCFWLADLKKSSPLKPLRQMNRNLVGSIYGRSSMKIANFVPIR